MDDAEGAPSRGLIVGVALLGVGLLATSSLSLPLALLDVEILRDVVHVGGGDRLLNVDEAQRGATGYARMLVLGLTFAVTGFTSPAMR